MALAGAEQKVLDELKLLRERVEQLTAEVRAGKSPPANEIYVDSEAIQEHFSVSRATVHNWVHDDGCPHEMRGKVLRFKLSAVEHWFSGRGTLKRVK